MAQLDRAGWLTRRAYPNSTSSFTPSLLGLKEQCAQEALRSGRRVKFRKFNTNGNDFVSLSAYR